MKFDLEIFATSSRQVSVQGDAVRHGWHKSFRKANGPSVVVVFQHARVSVPTRIGGEVPGAIVYGCPVHELEMAVASYRIHIEKLRERHREQCSTAYLLRECAPHRYLDSRQPLANC